MNDLLKKVGTSTIGIIWMAKGLPNPNDKIYESVDYLSNGLLTQTIQKGSQKSNFILVSKNFHENFFAYIFSEFAPDKFASFLGLISNELTPEKSIIVIDDINFFPEILKQTPEDLRSFLHLYQ